MERIEICFHFGPGSPQMSHYIFFGESDPEVKTGILGGKWPEVKQEWQNSLSRGVETKMKQKSLEVFWVNSREGEKKKRIIWWERENSIYLCD